MISRNSLSLLQCALSIDKHIVIQPLALSCGHNICKSCLPLNGNFKFKCLICEKQNKTDLYMCKESQTTKYLLKENIGYLLNNIHERMRSTLSQIKSSRASIKETLALNIEFIKEEINIRIESLKSELDLIQKELLKELSNIKREIILAEEAKKEIYSDYSRLESQLKILSEELKSTQNTNEKTLHLFQKDLIEAQKLLEKSTCVDYELNFNPSSFKHDFLNVGEINFKNKLSTILKLNEVFKLNRLCGWPQSREFKLIYRATRDGFSSTNFHHKCDSIPNTLMLVRSENGSVFGGYTVQTWSPSGSWKNDPQAFIFSFKGPNSNLTKIRVTKAQYAINPQLDRIAHFGLNGDLFIANNCNLNMNSFAQLNDSYALNVSDSQKYLTGETHFKVVEIEVFQVL